MKIFIATLPNGYFGSSGQSWKTLDVEKIASMLNFDTQIITVNDLKGIDLDASDVVIYTSSDEENIRQYLIDLMYWINKKCHILPSYEMLLSHENKGFQQLMRDQYGFGRLSGSYLFDIDDSRLSMPKVLKTVSGAGSTGVSLIRNKKDLSTIKKQCFEVSKKRKIIKFQRRLKLTKKEFSIYNYRHKGFNRIVEQEFISDLKNDFKVLVFGNRYYGLKRSIKKNDFRASGSGLFEFVKPPNEVLEFARSIFDELGNPYASLDIAQSDDGCHLLEFQGTNFGPIALLNSSTRCVYSDNGWIEEVNDKDLEGDFAHALNMFLGSN
ncbi:hypothetical protein J3492_12860 [Psychrobacter sp. F1192]|uniref:ATP-grasp domain-containing protein n=1 Tax=Psychrobacter coccoides TaxID=2818440 RepID=A0ABS3NS61_9GAMM|nr:hypothetical protein [Psychrobacter coccoides]MBO1532081.1 hypothetical protein [Psychrobacter coccoides]